MSNLKTVLFTVTLVVSTSTAAAGSKPPTDPEIGGLYTAHSFEY